MPFKGERVLAFLGHQPLSNAVSLEKTNQPQIVNYEQTVIVTELIPGSECELGLFSPSPLRWRAHGGNQSITRRQVAFSVDLDEDWTGALPGCAQQVLTAPGVARPRGGEGSSLSVKTPSKPRRVTRTDDSEVVSMRKLFGNNPAVSTGLPETLLLSPQNTAMSKCRRGANLRCCRRQERRRSVPVSPAEVIALTAHSRHGPVGFTHSKNSPLLTRISNTIDSRSASSPPPLPSSLHRAPPTCCRKSWSTAGAANELSRWEIWTQSEALIGGLSLRGSPYRLSRRWTTEITGGQYRVNLREQQHWWVLMDLVLSQASPK